MLQLPPTMIGIFSTDCSFRQARNGSGILVSATLLTIVIAFSISSFIPSNLVVSFAAAADVDDHGFSDHQHETSNDRRKDGTSHEHDAGGVDDGEYLSGSNVMAVPDQDNTVQLPVFVEEPTDAYVIKKKPATLQCKADHALSLHFQCKGKVKTESSPQWFVDPQFGIRRMEASINITREDVDEYFGEFTCECIAWSSRGEINSRQARVDFAYLKKQFKLSPYSQKVEVDRQVEIKCIPPAGVPAPKVYWLRNGLPLESQTTNINSNIIISADGHLLITQARLQDTANYTCVAENIAEKRLSDPAMLTVYVNGGWGPWHPWSECNATCGKGIQVRTRFCDHPAPLNGGATCSGPHTQKSECVSGCSAAGSSSTGSRMVEGKWSSWSEWSDCALDCKRYRRRKCDYAPSVADQSEDDTFLLDELTTANCIGKDIQSASCTGGSCNLGNRSGGLSVSDDGSTEQTSKSEVRTNVALYIGLTVAFSLFSIVILLALRIIKRKDRDHSMYNMANSEFHPEFFPDEDKKSYHCLQQHNPDHHQLAPDLTRNMIMPLSMPSCYEYPFCDQGKFSHGMTCSEHHYDVPHIANGQSESPSTPSLSSVPTDAQATSKSSESNRSLSSFTCSSPSRLDSSYDLSNSSKSCSMGIHAPYPLQHHTSIEFGGNFSVKHTVTSAGSRLYLADLNVSLTIPEGAIARGHKEEISLSVLQDDRHRPKLYDKQTQLSPVVVCGPSGFIFKKPVIINFQHCASLKHGPWNISVLCSESPVENAVPVWQKIVTLGEETLNTPLFTQLDQNEVFLVSDQLMRYVLIGEAVPSSISKPVKLLKLVIFGLAPSQSATLIEYSIRVYVIEDTRPSLENLIQLEKRIGGCMLDKPRGLCFQDGGANLSLNLEDVSFGWIIKPQSGYQEIPFQHIWNSTQNNLHCSFTLEKIDNNATLVSFRLVALQKGCQMHNRQMFRVNLDACSDSASSSSLAVPSSPVLCNNNSKPFRTITSSSGCGSSVTTCDQIPFRFTKSLRKHLCQCLDPPTSRGNDWRMLAQRLNIDRYINYFATKSSPTDHILDIWEARHREPTAVTELLNILRVMGRKDAATLLEKELGGPWL